MSLIFELLKNRFVKILALIAVIYFGVYNQKESPESLGNKLSKENIKKKYSEVKGKTNYIITNIKYAQELQNKGAASKQKLSKHEIAKIDSLKIEDEKIGDGKQVKCGDNVEFSYEIHAKNSSTKIEDIKNKKLKIGDNTDILLERKIIGMKKGAIRNILIPRNMKTKFEKLRLLLKFNEVDLIYRITLLDFTSINEEKNCN